MSAVWKDGGRGWPREIELAAALKADLQDWSRDMSGEQGNGDGRIGLVVDSYIELTDELRQAVLDGNVQRRSELLARRVETAQSIFDNPDELTYMASERPQYLEQVDADVKSKDIDLTKVDPDETSKVVFPDDVDPRVRQLVVSDPIEAFSYSNERMKDLVERPDQAPALHVLGRFQEAKAKEITGRLQLLTELGRRRSDLAEDVLVISGRSKGITAEDRERSHRRAYAYGAKFDAAEKAADSVSPLTAEAARLERVKAAAALNKDLHAVILLGKHMGDKPTLGAKILSDVQEGRGVQGVKGADDRLVSLEQKIVDANPELGRDKVAMYAFAREGLRKLEAGEAIEHDAFALRALAQKTSGEIKKSPEDLRKLVGDHPDLRYYFAEDAKGGIFQERKKDGKQADADAAASGRAGSDGGAVNGAKGRVSEKVGETDAGVSAQARSRNDASFRGDVFRDMPSRMGELKEKLSASQNMQALGLPLTAFSSNKAINRLLHKQVEPAEVARLYDNTVKMMVGLRKSDEYKSEAGRETHDHLEMGRRAMAEVLVRKGIRKPDDIAKDSYKLVSAKGMRLAPEFRRDPFGYIQKGDVSARAGFLRGLRESSAQMGENLKKKGLETAKEMHGVLKGGGMRLVQQMLD